MGQPQEQKYCFQTRIRQRIRSRVAYVPGMPAMSSPERVDRETMMRWWLNPESRLGIKAQEVCSMIDFHPADNQGGAYILAETKVPLF